MNRAILFALLLGASSLSAQTIAITGGRVVTNTGAPVDGGTVVIRDGRIVAAGANVPVPAGATVVDASGKWVTPGLISGFSQLGLVEVNAVNETNEVEADKSPYAAAIDVVPGLNPADTSIAITRIEGVTRAVTSPDAGGKLFAGQGAVIDLAEGPGLLMRPRAFQYMVYGEAGARLAGGSRPAAWLALTNALDEAVRYARNPAGYERDQAPDQLVPRRDAEALAAVVNGSQPLLVRVDRASDIRQLLTLKSRYPALRLMLLSANEGWMVADAIAAAKVPVITLGMQNRPERFEMLGATMNNVGRLTAAGVTVALGTPDLDASFQPRLMPQYAGNMVAQARLPGGVGLSWDQAFRTMTVNTAKVWGLNDLGTLEAGKRADVVIWDGDPLELASAPTAVFVDGVSQPMRSRQTELRDRYLNVSAPGDLPVAYKR
ncbi:amidohydrolase family protein [Sandaracinobacteroides saxicola]|uniref:Amidohydrolase family protein n=1 Tax=Sandaracinobacteroides saxicola TaxID=2759707 RepID=A0A7G5IDT3_9SPHN|nr:amidohydrolase family protein [Sandaracinobacteroides saxicola]QMW21525.1 amidohydrolase family protein [Sandaracinobacteroides saxicola]